MSGRHSAPRSARRLAAPLPAVAGALVLVVVGWFAFRLVSDATARQGCENPATVMLAAEPAIAPALAEIAAEHDSRRADTPQDCYRLQVESLAAGVVADRLTGIEAGTQPDVWVPDSTFWLRRAYAGGAVHLPQTGTSLASSPVVLAVAEPAARRLGWPDRELSWGDVVGATPTAEALRVGLPDPARNPVGLATLFGVRAATGAATGTGSGSAITGGGAGEDAGPGATPAQVAALRRLSPNVVTGPVELFDKLAPAYDPGAIDTAVTAFPATEQSVLWHNNTNPEQRLVTVYADPAVPALDFPYVVLPTAAGPERDGAERFLERLLGQEAQLVLQSRGLRTAHGAAGAEFPGTDTDRPAMLSPTPLPDEHVTEDVLRVWTAVNLSARMLTVVDVSGSMDATVPGTGRSRAQLTVEAAQQALGLFKDTTDMGLWVFSDNLDGDRDHRELAPIGPMATDRGLLVSLLDQVPGLVGGKTNLYDTVLAAYRTVLQGWDPARLNIVLVLTDGRDDDVSSIDRAHLVAELTGLQDPRRPVRLVFVGLGPDVDAGELDQLAGVTGGRAFTTPDPAGIRTVFAAALAELTCVTPDCRQ